MGMVWWVRGWLHTIWMDGWLDGWMDGSIRVGDGKYLYYSTSISILALAPDDWDTGMVECLCVCVNIGEM